MTAGAAGRGGAAAAGWVSCRCAPLRVFFAAYTCPAATAEGGNTCSEPATVAAICGRASSTSLRSKSKRESAGSVSVYREAWPQAVMRRCSPNPLVAFWRALALVPLHIPLC